MSRLPVAGQDDGVWGAILNDYLSVAHNSDGSLKPIPQTIVQGLTTSIAAKVDVTQVGHSGGVAALDADGDVTDATGNKVKNYIANIPHNPDVATLAGLKSGDLYTTS